jgi:DNA polymerase-4
MKQATPTRRILHVDLDPFFVAVERTRDASLRDKPLVIGGTGSGGRVAAVSEEARAAGVAIGQSMSMARRLCAAAILRPGDLETYARVSDEVTAILTTISPRVERPSIDEAFVDLSRAAGTMQRALSATESVRKAIQRRLGLDSSFGLGSSHVAARIASRWARPRGLLLLLPAHESSFVRRQPLAVLGDAPVDAVRTLASHGIMTLGDMLDAPLDQLHALLGRTAADHLRKALDPGLEPAIEPMAPPHHVQQEHVIRDRSGDTETLARLLDAVVLRATRKLAPFPVEATGLTVDVRRGEHFISRHERLSPSMGTAEQLQTVARRIAMPLLEPPHAIRALRVRLGPLTPHRPQYALFPLALGAKPA